MSDQEYIPTDIEYASQPSEEPLPHVLPGQEIEFPLPRDPDRRKKFTGDSDGLREAAKEVVKEREARQPQTEDVARDYRWQNGHGDPVDPSVEVSADQAAKDLDRVRQTDFDATQNTDMDRLASAVDNIRAAYPGRELPADFVPQVQQAAEAIQQQQSQPQPQTEQSQIQSQPQQPALPDGVDPEIAAALSNPKIRAALEAEVNAAETARQQFSQAALHASKMAAAALLSQHPHLASLSAQELPHALSAIEKVDAQKAAEIRNQLSQAKSLYDALAKRSPACRDPAATA
jgi:hypothetical protein